MASTITAPTYDPITTATGLAEAYVMSRQQNLDAKNKAANATATALTSLNSAISGFRTSLSSLTGLNKALFTQSATISDDKYGSATASATAAPGNYSVFVKQIATASQVRLGGLTTDAGVGGSFKVNLGGSEAFEVSLADADTDGDGKLSTRELALAINKAADNGGKVTASILNTGSSQDLVLTSKETGLSSAITLDTSGITGASSLKAANNDAARFTTLVQAQDAEIRLGSESGSPIIQASNTFNVFDGLKMTFTKAHATGEAPLTITVGTDTSATKANVQSFVDAFNALKTSLAKLTSKGNAEKGVAAAAFANDAGVRALNDRLTSLLKSVNGDTLVRYGITTTRTGTLSVDTDRLMAQLEKDPNGLDELMGSASKANPTGIAGALDQYLESWTSTVNGHIKQRTEANGKLQKQLTDRQSQIEKAYENAYTRYLKQFTALQEMQGIIGSNLTMLDALFGNDKD